MVNHDGYEIIGSSPAAPLLEERRQNWDIAIGLNQVDNLTPSKYLTDLVEQSVENHISYQEIETELHRYYEKQDINNPATSDTRECDLVATHIAELLEDPTFVFSPIYLKTIHARLLTGIWPDYTKYAGVFRDYNISKKEPILNGETVVYGDYSNILEYLKYDFDDEAATNYASLSAEQQIRRLTKFTSAIWQVHPFREGNARTTAVFIEKYLRSKGYAVNNDLFAEHAKYFRNALVLSNYANMRKGIQADDKYLIAFFEKLLIDHARPLPSMEIPASMSDRLATAADRARQHQSDASTKDQKRDR